MGRTKGGNNPKTPKSPPAPERKNKMKVGNFKIGNFRVVFGDIHLSHRDFDAVGEMLAFVSRLVRRHPDWTIGDTWRDEITPVQFVLDSDGTPIARDLCDYVRSCVAEGSAI